MLIPDPSAHTVVVGLGLGDEGKGTMIDALARRGSRPATVVRFNGGPQAAHHVVLPDGRFHCFSQFGSATLAGGHTHLSRFVAIEPLSMRREAEVLATLGVSSPLSRITLDAHSVVVTPFHKLVNRLQETARG